MKILVLAKNSFLEHIRDRFVLISAFISILLVLFSLVLGSMSFDEQKRILLHFGTLAIHISCLGFSLFLGSFVIQKEIERQTCLLVLVRPLSRFEFLVGKWLGVVILETVIWFVLSFFLFLLLGFLFPTAYPSGSYALAMIGTLLEAIVLLSACLFLGIIIRPAVAFFTGFCIFLIGHWQQDIQFFAGRSKNESFKLFAEGIEYAFPQLYRLNWRSTYWIENSLVQGQFLMALLHALTWIALFLYLAHLAFRRKDLV